ncbi:hypothetical protein GDO78_005223 [Eleutherodactylus coqui]|uniref:Uncharacterized protein n=1 Tax=Eleutherodactylus coqui TaxID=57060 RepID=A0A8J6FK89_ELECQ|nr:hypothetical protein GDO78_005223 [Eleutherodactylus coqui]
MNHFEEYKKDRNSEIQQASSYFSSPPPQLPPIRDNLKKGALYQKTPSKFDSWRKQKKTHNCRFRITHIHQYNVNLSQAET